MKGSPSVNSSPLFMQNQASYMRAHADTNVQGNVTMHRYATCSPILYAFIWKYIPPMYT